MMVSRPGAPASGRQQRGYRLSLLYFIRHGQASFGSDNYDQLSDLGVRQGEILGRHLAGLGVRFDLAFSGTMARQIQTAEAVLAGWPEPERPTLASFPEWNEYATERIVETILPVLIAEDPEAAAAAERLRSDRKAYQKVFSKIMDRWIRGLHAADEAEPWIDFRDRVRRGARKVMQETGRGRTVAVFSSGGPLSVMVQMALTLPDEAALEVNWAVKNASVSEFLFSGDRINLSSFNNVSHLEIMKEPGLVTYR